MRQNVFTISPYAAGDPDAVSLSQTPAAGGEQALAIDGAFASGGVATMDTARQVLLTFAADESARVFLITGTRADGKQLVEALAGTATTAQTVQPFTTVTEILIDDDSAGAIEAGTATVIQTGWHPVDYIRNPVNIGIIITVGAATADLTVELTMTNLLSRRGNSPLPTVGNQFGNKFLANIYPTVNPIDHDTLVNVTADASGNVAFPITGIRMQSNVIVVTNDVTMEFAQAGHRGA